MASLIPSLKQTRGQAVLRFLRFWLTNLRGYFNGYNIRPILSSQPLWLHTDASGVGYGRVVILLLCRLCKYTDIGPQSRVIKVPDRRATLKLGGYIHIFMLCITDFF